MKLHDDNNFMELHEHLQIKNNAIIMNTIADTVKARFLDQPQGEVHHVESYSTYQIWLNWLTVLLNVEILYHLVTRVHQ